MISSCAGPRGVRPVALAVALLAGLVLAGAEASRAAEPAATPPSDAEIAHIVVTANQVDVDAGELAKQKAHDAEVKGFAERMVVDHTAVNQKAAALAKKLSLTPKDNPTSQSLAKEGRENLASLQKLSGSSFDKAYIDHEVAYHQQVLDAIDQVLEPNAKNAELAALIKDVRPAIAAHLEHAKQIQVRLAGSAHKAGGY
jgi:putative membrane protein